ncbi:MAG: tetratricopeptide repeat protein [Chitinispirillaceae bacterium]|nr:tetratricopeptide repeat protein [Chitinispirillaceae bacterium]
MFAAFSPVLQNDFLNIDDDKYVTANAHIHKGIQRESIGWAFTKGYASNWHPLTWLSHMLDWNIFKNDPRGHHGVNLILHIINTLLLFLFLDKFTGRTRRSLIVAILFGVHPLHVESVAWVAERKDVLCAFFLILSMRTYCVFIKERKLTTHFLLIFLYACALMSKPMAITLPCVLLLLDYWPLYLYNGLFTVKAVAGRLSRLILVKSPLFILSLISGIITYNVQHSMGSTISFEFISMYDRCANAIMSYGIYLYKMLVPVNLAVFYPHVIDKTPVSLIAAVAVVLISLSTVFILYSRTHPYLLSGWLWYLGTLVPVIGIVQVGHQAYADRYTYIPITGIFILCVWGAGDFVNNYAKLKKPALIFTALIVLTLSLVTHQQIKFWKNSETLFRHAVNCIPYNHLAFNNLGEAVLTQGKTDKAIEYFKKALTIRPSYGLAHFNLGFQLFMKGCLEEARMHIEIGLTNVPNDAKAHVVMGLLCNQERKFQEAIQWLLKAASLDPASKDSWEALGFAYANSGKLERSFESYFTATRLGCSDPKVYNAMGELKRILKKYEESYVFYEKAIRLRPDYVPAYLNYAAALTAGGKIKEAEAIVKRIKAD